VKPGFERLGQARQVFWRDARAAVGDGKLRAFRGCEKVMRMVPPGVV